MEAFRNAASGFGAGVAANMAANLSAIGSKSPQNPTVVLEAMHSVHYADHCYTLGELKTRVAEHRCIIGGRDRGRKGFESSKGELLPAQARDYMGYIVACITHAVPPGDWAFRITLREMKSASIVVRMVCPRPPAPPACAAAVQHLSALQTAPDGALDSPICRHCVVMPRSCARSLRSTLSERLRCGGVDLGPPQCAHATLPATHQH